MGASHRHLQAYSCTKMALQLQTHGC